MKLNYKDLRIGNIIQWDHEESSSAYIVTNEILQDLADYEENPNQDRFARGLWYSSIPIDEEILKEAGFKTFGKTGDMAKGWVIVHKRKRGWVIRKSIPIMESFHQLQNYFYAITGQELTIPLFKNKF